jgi:hypothetical protein
MKQVYVLIAGMLLLSFTIFAQTARLSPLAAELFKGVKSLITISEKNFIAQQTGFILSGNKEQPFALDKDSKEYAFSITVFPTDLNKDGKEELFIRFGNTYTSGNTGSSVALFIKNASGVYEMNFGFPGMLPDVLTTANKGYPDVVIGGPGIEFPVFRWNGKAYDNYKIIKDGEYEKIKKTNAEELSKKYQQAIK